MTSIKQILNRARMPFVCLLAISVTAAVRAQTYQYDDLHDFGGTVTNADSASGPDGRQPYASVTFDAAGNMCGTTVNGGSLGGGMVWEITSAGAYRDLHDFAGTVINADGASGSDGYYPQAGVTLDAAGNLYGTTTYGGAYAANGETGMVWEITAAGAYKDLHDFGGTITYANGSTGTDGVSPFAGVTFDASGNMYGTASNGGANYLTGGSFGMVWEITAAGAYKDLHDFGGTITNANGNRGPDGNAPYTNVTFDATGNMYGTTRSGGPVALNGSGIVWEITAAGGYKDLHDFGGTVTNANGSTGPDGYSPLGAVTFHSAGNMYGTANGGGAHNATYDSGMVWEITAAGAYKDLHDFHGTVTNADGSSGPDGASPLGDVTFDSAGNMYGTTSIGGPYNTYSGGDGMVWEITAAGAYKDRHDFGGTVIDADGSSGPDGNYPQAGVTFDAAGNMYGTAEQGGAYASTFSGMVWEIAPVPVLTAISPSSALLNSGGFTLTVNGTGFRSGAVVSWNGAALSTSFVSSTQVQATVPSSDLTAAGTASITAANPGSPASHAVTFTINNPAPVLTAISPLVAVTGSPAVTITLTGSGFIAASVANWQGAALTTSFVSGASLTAVVPATDLTAAGAFSVTVANPTPGGGTTAGATFTVVKPILLSALLPATATAGNRQLSVKVSGTGFTSDCKLYWNGSVLSTSFVSSTELDALVPSSCLTAVGSFTITAKDSLGVESQNSLTFKVTPPFPIHLAAVEVNPAEVTGGATATGTVFLSGIAPAGGATVRLVSSKPGVVSVPRFVLVPEGTSTATFRINTLPPVDATACRITGTYLTVSRMALLTVDP